MNNFPAQQLNEEQPAANMGMSNADTDMHGLAAYDFVTLEVPLSLYDVSAYDALMHGYEVISGDPMPSYDANIDMAYYLDNPVSGSDDTAASSADSDFSIITNVDVDVAMLDNNRPSHNEATPPQGTSWSSEAYVDPPIAAFGPMFPTGTGTDTSTNPSVATPSLDSQAASDGEGSGESVQVFNIVPGAQQELTRSFDMWEGALTLFPEPGSVHLHLTANCADAMEIVYRAKPEYLATSAMYADKDDTLLTVAEYEHVNSILGRLDQQIEEAQTELAIQRFILLNMAETGVRRNYLKGLVDRNFDLQLDLHDSFQGANGAIDELHL